MEKKEKKPISILYLIGLFTFSIFILSFFIGIMILVRFVIFYVIILFLIIISLYLSIFGPSKYRYKDGDWENNTQYYHPEYDKQKWNVLLDIHSHTKASDGKLSVEENVKYHMSVGFNACVITDHNTMKNIDEVLRIKEKFKNKFILIPGLEYSTNRIHMCFIGITDWDCKKIPNYPTDKEIKEAIDKVHKMGGVVAVCHYPWSTWPIVGRGISRMPDHPTREQIYSWGVDLIECVNWDDDNSLIDRVSVEFAKSHSNISPCCGTDMHEPFRHPLCSWTVLNAEKFTEKAIIEELRNHKTDIILIEAIKYPIDHKENLWYKVVRPLMMLGEMFRDVYLWGEKPKWDVSALKAWISYFFIIFLIFELLLFFTS